MPLSPEQKEFAAEIASKIAFANRAIQGPLAFQAFAQSGRRGNNGYRLRLDSAQNAVPIALMGQGLSVVGGSAGAEAFIAFNAPPDDENALLPLAKGVVYKNNFDRVFITNTAQSGAYLLLAIQDDERFEAVNQNIGTIPSVEEIENVENVEEIDLILGQNWIDRVPTGFTAKAPLSKISPSTEAAATFLLGTVGVGKEWRIGHFVFSGSNSAAGRRSLFITDGADATIYSLASDYNNDGANQGQNGDPYLPIILPAGYKVKAYKEADAIRFNAEVCYYERAV